MFELPLDQIAGLGALTGVAIAFIVLFRAFLDSLASGGPALEEPSR